MSGYVEYTSNNSGGRWWLSDHNWKDLEAADWEVEWGGRYFCNSTPAPEYLLEPCPVGSDCHGHRRFLSAEKMTDADRWLGCLAKKARRGGLSLREAADEWERITGLSATAAGCPCCGQPHDFTEYDDAGRYISSGPETCYEAKW